jgi:ribosomal protein S18 acetylase RimI-like enzyme
VTTLKQRLKRILFGLLGKDPEAVVVSFLTGDEALARAMAEGFRRLVPSRRHYVVRVGAPEAGREGCPTVTLTPGSAWQLYRQLRRQFRHLRIGQAAVLFASGEEHRPLRVAAFLLAPGRILAHNAVLDRHHLRLRSLVSSILFLRGVPLDRIFLRPRWLCPWKRDRSSVPETYQILEGRPTAMGRPRVAVLSPYFPYPLSHGGAVRIFHLLRAAASQFDIFLFAFAEGGQPLEPAPVLEFCAKVILVPKPRYREPRWSTLLPPEVHEYRSPVMRRLLANMRRTHSLRLMQTEYTQLAPYGGDVLVEHDVTYDLYRQVHEKTRSLASWWNLYRWKRFERRALGRFRGVVAMSAKDAVLLGVPQAREIPNGVDLDRFRPVAERPGRRLLFIGSFRHFPNVAAYRFFTEEVWPLLANEFPDMTLTVVAGPDPLTFWRAATGTNAPASEQRIQLLGFIRDVRPLYEEATLVLVPTPVSAGTNVKVLEAMAMERAVVSTSCGCAGLGLEHGTSVWVADGAAAFAAGVRRLLSDDPLRRGIAQAARLHAQRHFSWKRLGAGQRALWAELLGTSVAVREALREDLPRIAAIQAASPEAAAWAPEDYLSYGCLVAVGQDRVLGFIAFRQTGDGEAEILNLAVVPDSRRQGVATRLVEEVVAGHPGALFLEVRSCNTAACNFYQKLGFTQVGLRRGYYQSPPDDGIVMRLQSC